MHRASCRFMPLCGITETLSDVESVRVVHCETLKYINDLKAAGVEAKVDIYEGMYHAFDMNEPNNPISKEAIKNFNEVFAYAKEHYFATQEH